MTQFKLNRQLEMFLRDGAERCYLDKGVLVYEFSNETLPCIHPTACVLVYILESNVWFEFCVDYVLESQSERFDTTREDVNCPMLYGWSESANYEWWERSKEDHTDLQEAIEAEENPENQERVSWEDVKEDYGL